ncbi:MAG TPA: CopG family antitoxin [Thermomicrobiales bacterium]
MAQSQPTERAVPAFRSTQEAAEFWDTHSTTEFEDHWQPVEAEVAQPLSRGYFVTIELDEATFAHLRSAAKETGVTADDLAKRWLIERLARDAKSNAAD